MWTDPKTCWFLVLRRLPLKKQLLRKLNSALYGAEAAAAVCAELVSTLDGREQAPASLTIADQIYGDDDAAFNPFVAPRTVRNLEAAMSDGAKFSGKVVASVGPPGGELGAPQRQVAKAKASSPPGPEELHRNIYQTPDGKSEPIEFIRMPDMTKSLKFA